MTDTHDALIGRIGRFWDAQQFEDVEQLARLAVSRYPKDERLRGYLARSLLAQGRYLDGFRENELRPHRLKAPPRQLPYPEWEGPIVGRSILVWGEQGIGDEIMFSRFVPRLRALGASRVTFACYAECVRAFQQLDVDLVVSRFGPVELPRHDSWVSLCSIPHRLGVRLEDVRDAPYLEAQPRGGGGIGLVERGSPNNLADQDRSIPAGWLQAAIPQGELLSPEGDVLDSLGRVAGLDLLITVDTSWAHMAGALGVPCWLLLPYRYLDWRWLRGRTDSPWYSSLRLFRQETPGDWPGVIEQVKGALLGQ
jgi:hypothetical protein